MVAVLILIQDVASQDLEIRIKIDEAQPSVARIEGKCLNGRRLSGLSFLPSYAGITGLANRISQVKLGDQVIDSGKTASGDYVASSTFSSFSYSVTLRQMALLTTAAHISWLSPDGGLLVLDDLLPQPTDKLHVRVTFDLPRGWRFISNEDRPDENVLNIGDAQRAVVFVGRSWRIKPVGTANVRLLISGEHQISDDAMGADAAAIYAEYAKTFGSAPPGPAAQIAIIRFPSASGAGAWEAETRGSTVTIVTSGGLSPRDAEQRLDQQLRHELFHLWLPNGVNLSGNYDWFYEGFATYEEQKMGVAINQIRFEDFLGTLGRAYDIDRFTAPRRSLIDASQDRWSGGNSQVYARGMLVAFLSDVALLDASKGKTSVESLLKQLFDEHRPPAAFLDGNEAIATLMRSHPELALIVDDYVSGSKALDWSPLLQKAGIQATTRDQLTQLAVGDKLTGRQKTLLDKLGYNNWRKLAPK